jgi:hypothetical protein
MDALFGLPNKANHEPHCKDSSHFYTRQGADESVEPA